MIIGATTVFPFMFEITFQHGHGLLTMLAVVVAAIFLVALGYRRVFGELEAGKWWLLFALRLTAVVLVALLLFRPVLTYQQELPQRPLLVFVLDTSASMSIADDSSGLTRFNQARQKLEQWWDRLRKDFELRLVEFAARARPLEGIEDLGALAPDGDATSLSRALLAAGRQAAQREGAAAVLLSDGIHNSARNPLEVAHKLGVPIHTIGVGASLRGAGYRDVQVTGFECPERLLLHNLARLKALVEGVGAAGTVVKVLLEEDGQLVAEQELALDDLEGPQEVVFAHRPTVKGRHAYTVRVDPLLGERIMENNRRAAVALVVEPGIRVLYVEGTLRAEYGAIVDRFLAKDPDIEFAAFVRTRGSSFLGRTNIADMNINTLPNEPEIIDKFDVFIIGDLDASFLSPRQQTLIIERVREGGGLLMLGGYNTLGPGNYAGAPLGEALPVFLGDRNIGQVTDEFLPVLTPDGVRHPIFANIEQFFPTQQQPRPKTPGLPPLSGCTRVVGPRPAATVLATLPPELAGPALPMPVLAVQPWGKGRSAVFCGDTTRNWHQGPRAMDQESPFARFWGQMVRWLSGRAEAAAPGAGVAAATDKAAYELEETVRLTAVVRNHEGQGVADAKVWATIHGPGTRPERITLAPVAGPPGHYAGNFDPRMAGSYEIAVEAQLAIGDFQAEKLSIEVGRPHLEFEKIELDEKLLAQIADATGGRYYHITTADNLIERLDRTQRKKRLTTRRDLAWPPLCWMLLVGALATEWFLRKRFLLR